MSDSVETPQGGNKRVALLIALLAWGVTSFLRKVREPVD